MNPGDNSNELIGRDDDVKDGERYAQSELTGQWYRVTRWVEKGDGKIRALQKEEIDEPPHADEEKVHCPDCDTTTWADTIEDAVNKAEKHDDAQHDGERTTEVNGMTLPSDDAVEAAQDAVNTLQQHDIDLEPGEEP